MTDSEEREEFAVEVPEIPNETDADDSGGDTNNRRKGDTKVGLTLRIVVALYVLYLAYDLIRGFGETAAGDRIFIAAAIGIFLIAGGAILAISAKKLIRKEYIDADGETGSEKR